MKKICSILLTLSISLNSFSQEAVKLTKDQPAPFTGILITFDDANNWRKDSVERDGLKAINESLNATIKLQDDIITRQNTQKTVLLDQNDKLAMRLGEAQSLGTWEKVGFIALGIAASGVAAIAFKKVYQ